MKNRRKLITTIEKLLILIVAVTILAGIVITIQDRNKKKNETQWCLTLEKLQEQERALK